MESAEIERKLREIDDKVRIDLARNKVELIKIGYKTSAEQCERLRVEIRQGIRRMVQEELLFFKRENYALQRQINALQQHIEAMKWDHKRNERKTNYELEQLRNHIRELAEQIEKQNERNNLPINRGFSSTP
jgi:HAMP domain-containing protein